MFDAALEEGRECAQVDGGGGNHQKEEYERVWEWRHRFVRRLPNCPRFFFHAEKKSLFSFEEC